MSQRMPACPRRRGQSLVGLLVVVAIIAIAVWFFFFWGPGRRGGEDLPAVSTPGAALQQARGVECTARLQQVRQALQMAQMTEGNYPDSLSGLAAYGVAGELLQCPESGQPYIYDPASGQVSCPTHAGQ